MDLVVDFGMEFVVDVVVDFAVDFAMDFAKIVFFEHIWLDNEHDICRRFYIEKESRSEDNQCKYEMGSSSFLN
jgi:hypothetical protein